MDSDIKLQNGTVEISGDKLKTSVSQLEMYYYGGRLAATGGNVELGSSDSGTFKGFSQLKDGTVQITGDKLKAVTGSAEIGSQAGGTFKGIILSDSGIGCYAYSLMVMNPNVRPGDGQQRMALAQSANDELLINANGHYKGGIKLDGPVNVGGDLSVQTVLQMKAGSKLLLLTPDRVERLPNGRQVRIPGVAMDVLETLQNLQEQVRQLQDKVAALGPK